MSENKTNPFNSPGILICETCRVRKGYKKPGTESENFGHGYCTSCKDEMPCWKYSSPTQM
jgi:hypothetical protein